MLVDKTHAGFVDWGEGEFRASYLPHLAGFKPDSRGVARTVVRAGSVQQMLFVKSGDFCIESVRQATHAATQGLELCLFGRWVGR